MRRGVELPPRVVSVLASFDAVCERDGITRGEVTAACVLLLSGLLEALEDVALEAHVVRFLLVRSREASPAVWAQILDRCDVVAPDPFGTGTGAGAGRAH